MLFEIHLNFWKISRRIRVYSSADQTYGDQPPEKSIIFAKMQFTYTFTVVQSSISLNFTSVFLRRLLLSTWILLVDLTHDCLIFFPKFLTIENCTCDALKH